MLKLINNLEFIVKFTFNFLVCLFLLSSSLYAIEGSYDVKGKGGPPCQEPYTATATITKDKGDVFQASWLY